MATPPKCFHHFLQRETAFVVSTCSPAEQNPPETKSTLKGKTLLLERRQDEHGKAASYGIVSLQTVHFKQFNSSGIL